MPDKLKEVMAVAVTETLENMLFMEVIETDEAISEIPDAVKAGLLVHEPFPGEFRLTISRGLAGEISESLYSMNEEEISDQILFDVLGELLNTIAGRIMTSIVPGESTFRLGLPETGAEVFLETDSPSVQCNFEIEGQYFSLIACGETLSRMGGDS